jgi:selenocysteine lyase/cysteine desulfurase
MRCDCYLQVFVHEGRLYVRVSCALYNDRDDIEALGNAVLAIAATWWRRAESDPSRSLSKL